MINHGTELTKILMQMYDQGASDTTAAAMEAMEKAIEQEREACALIAMQGTGEPMQTAALKVALAERERIAAAIRARGEE
jgi:hypothetical protein